MRPDGEPRVILRLSGGIRLPNPPGFRERKGAPSVVVWDLAGFQWTLYGFCLKVFSAGFPRLSRNNSRWVGYGFPRSAPAVYTRQEPPLVLSYGLQMLHAL